MFLNTTLFKRELKESYNGFGVEVIRFEDGVLHVKGRTCSGHKTYDPMERCLLFSF